MEICTKITMKICTKKFLLILACAIPTLGVTGVSAMNFILTVGAFFKYLPESIEHVLPWLIVYGYLATFWSLFALSLLKSKESSRYLKYVRITICDVYQCVLLVVLILLLLFSPTQSVIVFWCASRVCCHSNFDIRVMY